MKSRREFLRTSGYIAAGFLGLQRLSLHGDAGAQSGDLATAIKNLTCFGYGPIQPDPNRIFDLPKGFSYQIIARTGDLLDDSLLLPGDPDGMAAFPTPDGRVALICNHELDASETHKGAFGPKNERLAKQNPQSIYDAGYGTSPQLGGTSTLIYNPSTSRKELHYLSLAGTERNCAGGPTPWNTWITCEETTTRRGTVFEKDHGYNFEVPVSTEIKHFEAVPLKAMGRFRHEAVSVEPKSGIVYQTEDLGDGLIYRFIPNRKGKLAEGGKLQALMLQEAPSCDTRNWPETKASPFPLNTFHPVKWVDLEDVESPDDTLRIQGFEKGAARFARGEGMWYGNGEIYFACTNGGRIQQGQIFRYLPSPYEGTDREHEMPGKLELFVESGNAEVLKNCDNLTIAPNGNLFICEDAVQPCKIVGITPEGSIFEFAANSYTDSELAGVCFAPDGQTLFVNIQKDGLTLAITGPWEHFRT